MRIAMVAPLTEAVPPNLYGGVERVVSALTEELVQRGHALTLFASGDSRTGARLVSCCPRSLRLDSHIQDFVSFTLVQLDQVYLHADEFDIIHNHTDYLAFPFARLVTTPTITTTHGRLDLPDTQRIYRHFGDLPLVSISASQRSQLPEMNWVATVYNGVDPRNFHYCGEPGDYLAFVGRISPEKGPDRAIEIAREVGMRLIIAAKVDPVDTVYFDQVIAPLIRECPLVEYVGEVDESRKDAILGGAYAYLFPIDWPEPFGLTMAEAMATGTPVLAYRAGSVPEVVVDGVTGFICDSVDDLVEAIPKVKGLDRQACRSHIEKRFSLVEMANQYEQVYGRLMQEPRLARQRTRTIEGRRSAHCVGPK